MKDDEFSVQFDPRFMAVVIAVVAIALFVMATFRGHETHLEDMARIERGCAAVDGGSP